jgi:hypothetical protein
MGSLNAWGLEAGWGQQSEWLRPLFYATAALCCALLGTSRRLAPQTPAGLQKLWRHICPLYLLIAASCLVQADVLWVHWARDFSREHHLYGARRLFQVAALAALAWLAWLVWAARLKSQRGSRQAISRASLLRRMLLTGVFSTVTLYLLRYVSFHYTDMALNAIVFEHSLALWVEYASLGLFGLASGLELLRSYGHV